MATAVASRKGWRRAGDRGSTKQLDVRILLADLPLSRLRASLAALTGRLPRSKAYLHFVARELRAESPQPRLRLAHDGEYFDGHGSFVIEKLPRRLLVHARHEPAA